MFPPKSPMSEKTLSTDQIQHFPEQPHNSLLPEKCILFSLLNVNYSAILSVKHPAIQHHVLPQARTDTSALQEPGLPTAQLAVQPEAKIRLSHLHASAWASCWTSHLLAGMQKLWWMESTQNSPDSDMQIYSANAAKIKNALKKPVSRLYPCMKWSHRNRTFDSIRPFNKSEVSPWEGIQGSQGS